MWQTGIRGNQFVDGLCWETCRDLGHVNLGFGSMTYAAETAWKQGFDLFEPNKKRLTDFMELHGTWMTRSVKASDYICDGVVKARLSNTSGITPPQRRRWSGLGNSL